MEKTKDKLKQSLKLDFKFKCKEHHSDIGGSCNNFDCKCANQLFCVKCSVDPNLCIRKLNHNIIPVIELVDNYDLELKKLQTNFNYKEDLTNLENILKNVEDFNNKFKLKIDKINSQINSSFENLSKTINDEYETFNKAFLEAICIKEKNLENSIFNLFSITNFDFLCEFNKEELIKRMDKMNFETLNTTILKIKLSLRTLKNKAYLKDMLQINNALHIDDDYFINLDVKFNNLLIEVKNECEINRKAMVESFNKLQESEHLQDKKIKSLQTMNLMYSETIDYSINSNFLNKKFTVFEHSNGEIMLAYPTSQNTIKIEIFSKIFDTLNLTQYSENSNLNNSGILNTFPTNNSLHNNLDVNSRDHLLYFKLQSHGAQITEIVYFKLKDNNSVADLLISASEDKSIKIWNITSLQKYKDIKDMDEYYKINNVRTMLGHNGKISCMLPFYSEEHGKDYLVSLGLNDKIKIWEIKLGILSKEIGETNLNQDSVVNVYKSKENKTVYIITGNHKGTIRVFNFDLGILIYTAKYPNVISSIVDIGNDQFFIVDVIGKCAILNFDNFPSLNTFSLLNTSIEDYKTERIAGISFEDSILFYCKNGMIYEYSLKEKQVIGSKKISLKAITCCLNFKHAIYKSLLFIHSQDQRLNIFC